MRCSEKHYNADPFAIEDFSLTRLLGYTRVSDEDLARELHKLRATKEIARFRLQAWKETIEAQLDLWNPF